MAIEKGNEQGLRSEQIEDRIGRIHKLLADCKGRPAVKRTSRKKLKKVDRAVVQRVIDRLSEIEIRRHSIAARICGLYIVVMPSIGMRPTELAGSELTDKILRIPNAKKRPQHADYRSIDLSAFPDEFVAAVGALIVLVRAKVAEVGYARWHNALRDTLARACADVRVKRMSPYLFRHVAIATWKAAGMSQGDVAKLCGHVGLRTAGNHYASGRHGWTAENGLARAGGPEQGSSVRLTSESSGPEHSFSRVLGVVDELVVSKSAVAGVAQEAAPEHLTIATARTDNPARDEPPLAAPHTDFPLAEGAAATSVTDGPASDDLGSGDPTDDPRTDLVTENLGTDDQGMDNVEFDDPGSDDLRPDDENNDDQGSDDPEIDAPALDDQDPEFETEPDEEDVDDDADRMKEPDGS